ncbi:DUF397 domain-containing protein [Saccharopolyspora gregorii]|uniref:DUF397 domain-containing protein n=1 Tax=Saccharopolyspora gregorii TaxID=33914 RepID=UPI0021ACC9FC|nr:DUF397 domain-containing protein [Saccharopolyspora gregorii]
MAEPNWRTSTYSGDYNCVEVALLPESAAIRDSKDRAAGFLSFSSRAWQRFLFGIKTSHCECWAEGERHHDRTDVAKEFAEQRI